MEGWIASHMRSGWSAFYFSFRKPELGILLDHSNSTIPSLSLYYSLALFPGGCLAV